MLNEIIKIARDAGRKILEVRDSADLRTSKKADDSPVTQADLRANEVILKGLRNLSEDLIVSEETNPSGEGIAGEVLRSGRFWLVDPLDGTKDFVAGSPTFVVSIGLIEKGDPVLGVIYAPALDEVFWAERGKGAYRNGTLVKNQATRDRWVAVASRSHPSKRIESFIEKFPVERLERIGSALKFGRLAQGEADVYLRFGKTSEWDTAAGQLIATEGGCQVIDLITGQPMRYGKTDFLNHPFAATRRDIDLLDSLRQPPFI